MKKLTILFALALISLRMFGQTPLESAKAEIEKENYLKAINILWPMLAEGASERDKAAYFMGNAFLKNDQADSAKIFYRMMGGAQNKSAWGMLGYGRLTLLNGDLKAAETLFEQAAIKSNMKNSEILYQIGDALFKPTAADLQKAIGYFEDAYKLDNKNTLNMLELGDAYLDNNEGGKAMSKYESAADVDPKLTMAFIKIGRLNYRAHTYDDAISAYKKAINLEPDYALAHWELGQSYYLSKKYDLAKPEFKKYIELNKDDADAKTKFLTFLFQIKEYEQCASEAQSMLKDDPTNFLILRALFYSDYELKRYKEGQDAAQRFWVAAPAIRAKSFDYVYTAKLAVKGGDTALALKYFPMALQNDSLNGELLSDYAMLMFNTRHYYEAIANYTKKVTRFAGAAAPNAPTFYDYYYLGRSNYYIALSFKSQKDNPVAKDSAAYYFQAADTAFSKLTSKWATTADSWQWRAKANNNLDPEMKSGAAKPYYEQYIKIAEAATDPKMQDRYKNFLIESYQYLGAFFLNTKDAASARSYLEKASKLDPENETTKELMKGL